MQEFTKKDCVGIGEEVSLKSRVVVLAPRALPGNHPGQLFFCTGVQGRKIQGIPLPSWYLCLLEKYGSAGIGM